METSKYKILIIDDEKDVREILKFNISQAGYKVYTAKNGTEGLIKVKEKKPHLVILDVMMPKPDGYETCSEIRKLPENKKTIILFLSARNEDYSQIKGFEAGGDDYIAKPVNPKVLLSKIKASLKRYQIEEIKDDKIISFGEYKLNKNEYTLYKNSKNITLPKKQFEILRLLFSKPNHVFGRDEIFEKIWGNDVIVGSRTIDVHIRKIREKTGIENIVTLKGIGYKLETESIEN
ncbi:MAG: response regulator transcription factor [Bacteroidales bacterium]|nr:response regulator transcription factor [Bacteroidales bacterium]